MQYGETPVVCGVQMGDFEPIRIQNIFVEADRSESQLYQALGFLNEGRGFEPHRLRCFSFCELPVTHGFTQQGDLVSIHGGGESWPAPLDLEVSLHGMGCSEKHSWHLQRSSPNGSGLPGIVTRSNATSFKA